MKKNALQTFRHRLAADETMLGLWITLESASITEMAVALGFDWVVIDTEHGHLDWKLVLEHLRATVRSDTVALVRITQLDGGSIKRALDLGADGIVIPWIESAEQLAQAVAFARYPPEGIRGIGGERATAWGQCLLQHVQEANEHVLVAPIIETRQGIEQVADISRVEGVDFCFFGPADLSSSYGFRGQWEGPGVAEAILRAKDQLRAGGKHCGLLATSHENILQRQAQGFRVIGVGSDAGLLAERLRNCLQQVGRPAAMRADLTAPERPLPAVLPRPPESMRPDRRETITCAGEGARSELTPTVIFETLVSNHNGARNLTTGIATFSPEGQLLYHMHPSAEAITVLEGQLLVEVEGRGYRLGPLDSICIPKSLAHRTTNVTVGGNARAHVSMSIGKPVSTRVATEFPPRMMPDSATGENGKERCTRFAAAPRVELQPNTEFIDLFNARLQSGLDMSGGYGLFRPGGRLPAHVHDFDESICIIQGEATCVVEGRQYHMSNLATAMQPRGRVHYFTNNSQQPMAMLWVYAGPLPERIVIDEHCATLAGDPWLR